MYGATVLAHLVTLRPDLEPWPVHVPASLAKRRIARVASVGLRDAERVAWALASWIGADWRIAGAEGAEGVEAGVPLLEIADGRVQHARASQGIVVRMVNDRGLSLRVEREWSEELHRLVYGVVLIAVVP